MESGAQETPSASTTGRIAKRLLITAAVLLAMVIAFWVLRDFGSFQPTLRERLEFAVLTALGPLSLFLLSGFGLNAAMTPALVTCAVAFLIALAFRYRSDRAAQLLGHVGIGAWFLAGLMVSTLGFC
jgi:hypothetical protein